MNYFQEHVAALTRQLYAAEDLTERVVFAKGYIDQFYHEPIDLGALAKASCLSKFHFIRVFKRYYGQTPGQYLKEVRIRHAKRLISAGMPAKEAALEVGYSSVSSFHSLYKFLTGKTPGATQKAILENQTS